MKIFVTGATGFIGRNLVEKFIADGHDITINLRAMKTNSFSEDVKTYQFGKRSISDDIDYLKAEAFDGVIHLASYVQSGQHSYEDIEELIDSNIKFSTTLLEASTQAKIKWFINTGTYWQHFDNKEYSPVNLYAATKQAFLAIAKFYIETDKIKFNTIELFDTYSINDNRPKIFNLWEKIAESGESISMSLGNQLMDISYIDDIVDAFSLLAAHLHDNLIPIENGAVFSVTADKRYSLRELATIFENITKKKLNISWGLRGYRDREVMTPWTNGRVVPGWHPKVFIKDGLMKILEAHGLSKY